MAGSLRSKHLWRLLAGSLNISSIARVSLNGSDRCLDSYSGFFDNGGIHETGLGGYLRDRQVNDTYLLGLTTDYCVRATALDACRLGFRTWLIEDACRGVELQAGRLCKRNGRNGKSRRAASDKRISAVPKRKQDS